MVAQPVEVTELVHVAFEAFDGHWLGWCDQKDLSACGIRFQLICGLVVVFIGIFQAFYEGRVFMVDPPGKF